MNPKLSSIVLLTFAMVMTACSSASRNVSTPSVSPSLDETNLTPAEVVADAATGTPVPAEPRAATPTPTLAADPNVVLQVSHEEKTPFLVDEQRRSLYVYMNDDQHSGTSVCLDDCAVGWPPLVVTGMPAAGEEVDASLLGVINREDGLIQVTYNGWPLYYSNQDTLLGSTNGQSYNGVWFLISAAGDPIQR